MAMTENRTQQVENIIYYVKSHFIDSDHAEVLRREWSYSGSLSYWELDKDAYDWMNETLWVVAEATVSRFERVYSKRGMSQEWIEANIANAIQRELELEEIFLWGAEIASRIAKTPEEQRWLLS